MSGSQRGVTGDRAAATAVQQVPIAPLDLGRFEQVLPKARWQQVQAAVVRAHEVLRGRVVWNLNSTANGGGVAEMLRSLIGYACGLGVDARWLTISGDAPFFAITKRLHNRLHGSPGDGGSLGDAEREAYERPLRAAAEALVGQIAAEDLVLLHDPQTAPLIPLLAETGAPIAWRSHIGHDAPNELALEAWRFLLPYVRGADVCIFSRASYAWEGLDRNRLAVIHPSIDVFSVKNEDLNDTAVKGILIAAGLIDAEPECEPLLTRPDGSTVLVERRADIREASRLAADTPVVVQVSRWDRLKDPAGVMDGFVSLLNGLDSVHLMLAGPETGAVSDDPEGAAVLREVHQAWERLDAHLRERVHLVSLPMADADENAAIVNALQRHATIVCQKSIAEGFGLTVAEAMWKSRPVVATRVGGIQDQIVHGVSGLLINDPHDLRAFGAAVSELVADPARARKIGRAAHRRARDRFLGPEHLIQYLELFDRLLAG
jgi:trehalose synthase